MDTLLIVKEKKVSGNDLELVCHINHPYDYAGDPHPVKRYLLSNCVALDTIDLENIDSHNDGVTINIIENGEETTVEITEQGDDKTMIRCSKATMIESEYSREDFISIIKEFKTVQDNETEWLRQNKIKLENLKRMLMHELENSERKLTEASWLNDNAKTFIKGQHTTLTKVIQSLNEIHL